MLQMLFEYIVANLVHYQAENLQNVQKMSFWQNAPGVNGLNESFKIITSSWAKTYTFSIDLF